MWHWTPVDVSHKCPRDCCPRILCSRWKQLGDCAAGCCSSWQIRLEPPPSLSVPSVSLYVCLSLCPFPPLFVSVCLSVHAQAYAEDRGQCLDVFFRQPLLYFLRWNLFLNLELAALVRLPGQWASGIQFPLVSLAGISRCSPLHASSFNTSWRSEFSCPFLHSRRFTG